MEQIRIARLPRGADPGVTGLPFVDLAARRAAQWNCDARKALEQNPLGLESGRNRGARARALNQNVSQGRVPMMLGDTRLSVAPDDRRRQPVDRCARNHTQSYSIRTQIPFRAVGCDLDPLATPDGHKGKIQISRRFAAKAAQESSRIFGPVDNSAA
jgi:hypothetical protein